MILQSNNPFRPIADRQPVLGPQVDWSHPLANGLLGFYAFNEGQGQTLNDLAGSAGTLSFPFPGWGSSPYGCAGKLVTGIGGASLAALPRLTADFSFACFINWSGAGGTYQYLWSDWAAGSYNYLCYISGGTIVFQGNSATITAPITANRWTHIVFTRRGSTSNIYKDGVLAATSPTAAPGTLTTNGRYLFANGTNGETPDGLAAFAAIYQRALPAEEVLALYREPYILVEMPGVFRYLTASGSAPAAARRRPPIFF